MANQRVAGQPVKARAKPKGKRKSSARKASARNVPKPPWWQRAAVLSAEILALSASALVVVIAVLGRSAQWFGGTTLTFNLIPFAATVLGLALVSAVFMALWLRGRAWLRARGMALPAVLSLLLALAAGGLAAQEEFSRELRSFRTLVGGRQEAERVTLAHQVFASYRRANLSQMERLMGRAEVYLGAIREAARSFGVDEEILVGVAAAESSFLPRDSKDGGRGLFQITAPPKIAVDSVKKKLGVSSLDLYNQRHNSLVAAATLQHYLSEMGGDLFLGLLAYNIGPRNGGLRAIMEQYGARDFVTIQPYLQNLPRDYPIRVLTAALAYRLWRLEGKLPRYEEGKNALHIQSIGVPGLAVSLPRDDRRPV